MDFQFTSAWTGSEKCNYFQTINIENKCSFDINSPRLRTPAFYISTVGIVGSLILFFYIIFIKNTLFLQFLLWLFVYLFSNIARYKLIDYLVVNNIRKTEYCCNTPIDLWSIQHFTFPILLEIIIMLLIQKVIYYQNGIWLSIGITSLFVIIWEFLEQLAYNKNKWACESSTNRIFDIVFDFLGIFLAYWIILISI